MPQVKNTDNNNKEQVIIFDTTLRDGEQSPGCSMNSKQKLKVAHQLAALGVDVIEAGFAIASPDDFNSIKTISEEVEGSIICSLSRTKEIDIKKAGEAIAPAEKGRIHTFIATSPIHMEEKLRMTPDQVVKQAINGVTMAKEYTDDVEFSCEDAFRSDFDFLCHIIEKTIDAGATTINIPDTVGYASPDEYGALINRLVSTIPNADQAIFSTHCHNDLGTAVANSIAGVKNGARQIECTINGIGERAGNAALEEVAMNFKTRTDWGFYTNINTPLIVPTSQLIVSTTGSPIQPNKAIVGANAFAHESGIHQDGMLKNRETYEIMKPEDVGATTSLVLAKHSGRAAIFSRMEELGFPVPQEKQTDFFKAFKDLADAKGEVYDKDLIAIHLGEENKTEGPWSLKSVWAKTAFNIDGQENEASATITLQIEHDHQTIEATSTGDGIVNATFNAIKEITGLTDMRLDEDFRIDGVSKGSDAQGASSIRVVFEDKAYHGRGVDTDVTISATKAIIDAVNQIEYDTTQQQQIQQPMVANQ